MEAVSLVDEGARPGDLQGTTALLQPMSGGEVLWEAGGGEESLKGHHFVEVNKTIRNYFN